MGCVYAACGVKGEVCVYAACGVKGELCVCSVWSEGWGVCIQCVEG